MAKKGFSLATPLGVFAVRPDELWRGANLVAAAAADRARAGLSNLANDVTTVADRIGGDLAQAQRQNAQQVQALAAKAPRVIAGAHPALTAATKAAGAGRKSASSSQAARPVQQLPIRKSAWLEPLMTVDAFVRGAGDILTVGKADEMEAALEASVATVGDWASGRNGSFHQYYEDRLALQQERDRFDETYRPIARTTGQGFGVLGSLAVGSGLGSGSAIVRMLPNGARIVRNAQPVARLGLDMRGVNTIAAVGRGMTGAADQLATDLSKGEFSGVNAYAASTLAGVAGGIAGRYSGPAGGGAVAGGLTPVLQSTAAGRPSLEGAAEGATFGAIEGGFAGHAANALGKYGSSALPIKWKGGIGEGMSLIKSVARDGKIPKLQVPVEVGSRRKTIADQVLEGGALLEAKFGRWAKLSKAQRAALRQFGAKYIIDHYLPKDVGSVLGVAVGVGAGVSSGQQVAPAPA